MHRPFLASTHSPTHSPVACLHATMLSKVLLLLVVLFAVLAVAEAQWGYGFHRPYYGGFGPGFRRPFYGGEFTAFFHFVHSSSCRFPSSLLRRLLRTLSPRQLAPSTPLCFIHWL